METNLAAIAPIHVDLSTELQCLLRPVTIVDIWRAKVAYTHLGEESRQSRFWQASQKLSDDLAIRLSQTDSYDHRSWIAFPSDSTNPLPGYGAASFWRSQENPKQAEFSATILDDWQRNGFGSLLLAALWFDAWQLGIKEFTGIARLGHPAITSWWLSAGGTIEPQSQHLALSLQLKDPEEFARKRSYRIHLSTVESDLAHWFQTWLELIKTSNE